MRLRVVFTALVFLTLTSIVRGGTLREEFDQTFDLRMGGRLFLSNMNGGVTVESWDRSELRVEAVKIVKARDRRTAEEAMTELRIEIDYRADFLEIQTRFPRKNDGLWGLFRRDENISMSVKYRLTVPTDLDMDVSTVNGSVDVYDVSGVIRVTSTNGHVHVSRARGTVDAKTTNGGIEAELVDFDRNEDMSFRTTNGGIKVYFPRDFSAYVDAKTTNGSIRTDFPIEVRGRFKKNRLEGAINRGGGRITLRTTNGSIKVLER